MVNQVDVSQETVEREWARIVQEHQALPVAQPEPEPVAGGDPSGLNFEGIEGVQIEPGTMPVSVRDVGPTSEEKIELAKTVIKGALVFGFNGLAGFDIPEDKFDRLAETYAVVIEKHFKGGLFAFLAMYKEELAAAAATLAFIGVVREHAKAKAEREAEKRQSNAEKRQAEREVKNDKDKA